MSELTGQKDELTSLQSKIDEVLAGSDPKLRRAVIRGLFTQEFSGRLSPQFQQELQGLAAFDNIPVNAATENETPKERVERLLRNVIRAEFASHQEYSFVSNRSEKGFVSVKAGLVNSSSHPEDYKASDLVDSKFGARAWYIPDSIARMIDPSLLTSGLDERLKNEGELYCLVGERGGKIIIQGGGVLHSDFAHRPNYSSFKLVFDSEDAANEYINWLQTDPKDAYGTLLRRVTGSYDEQGNFKEALIPPTGGEKFHDPFSVTPQNVLIKDLRTSNPPTSN